MQVHFDDRNSAQHRTTVLQLTTKQPGAGDPDAGALCIDRGGVVIEARNGRLVIMNSRELLHGVLPGKAYDRGAVLLYSQDDVETWAVAAQVAREVFGV
jgi:hypothetical protein